MIIIMESRSEEDLQRVIEKVKEFGYTPHILRGVEKTVVAAIGDERGKMRLTALKSLAGVEAVVPILKPFKLAGREVKHEKSVFNIGGVEVGGNTLVVMAGPCSIESREQLMEAATAVKAAGAKILRGGAFKPRTSPYAFQGLEAEGLQLLAEARSATGMPVITEVLNPRDVELVAEYSDIIQIGARNSQNFTLLREVGATKKPVLLKRGAGSTVNELLMSAEYILSEGNYQVMICERGIRTFEDSTRFTLDLSAIPVLKKQTHLPIIVDPSHATGHWDLVAPMALAAIAAGADGLIIEVHPHPEDALSDGPQSLKPKKFAQLMEDMRRVAAAVGRGI